MVATPTVAVVANPAMRPVAAEEAAELRERAGAAAAAMAESKEGLAD